MHRLQRLLLCLLCAVMPVRGIAGMLAAPAPCPMTQAIAPAVDAAGADACCEHGDPGGAADNACKANQDCPCGGFGVLVSGGASMQRPQAVLRPLRSPLAAPTFDPSRVWRPPTLL